MPKTTQQQAARMGGGDDDGQTAQTSATLCSKADALFRAAVECLRQHERLARLANREAPEAEQKAASAQVEHCDGALLAMTRAYEKCGARLHPDGDDEAWWHRANSLWHASREYARRHEESMEARRSVEGDDEHEPEALGQLNIEYELEASALLALRQATEAYKKVRPHADC